MSNLVIFDTSIFIDHLRSGRHQDRIEVVTALVRTSAVVLAELWRGVAKPAEREFLRALARSHPILTPTERNWLESGQLLAKIFADKGLFPSPAALKSAPALHAHHPEPMSLGSGSEGDVVSGHNL